MNYIKEPTKDFYLLDSRIENIFINEYMPTAPGEYVKVFIYGCMYAEHNLPMDNATMAKQLSLEEKQVQEAWDYWEKMGAVKRRYIGHTENMEYAIEYINLKELLYGKNVPEKREKVVDEEEIRPEKMSEETVSLRDSSVKDMFKEMERILGRTLDSGDISKALSWLNAGASSEMILRGVKYCIERNKTSFSYLNKIITEWIRAGLNTVEQVEEHLEEMDEKYYRYRRILKALGFTRNATEKEKELMDSWFDHMGFSMDKVLEACTKTAGISNPNFNYVNSVLENWKKDAESRNSNVNKTPVISQADINRYYDYLREKAEEEADIRKAEVYKALPKIKEIDDQVAQLSYDLSVALIKGNAEQEGKKIGSRMEELVEERAILLTENNYEMDYTDIKYKCDKCNDTGITELGERCSCIKQRTEEAEIWVKKELLKR